MTNNQELAGLISALDSAVAAGLAYFEGPGAESDVTVGDWVPREVLCHMVFWHQATVDGMESVASGGDPYRIDVSTDEANARIIERLADESMAQLAQRIRALQARLVAAVLSMPDPSAAVLGRGGSTLSAANRLELMARHWNGHIQELQAAR